MNFEKEINGDIVIEKIHIKRATYKEAEEFRNFIQSDIQAGWIKIIIDMKECEFIDSSFLGVLINALKELKKSNGTLGLASVNEEMQTLLDITMMSGLFSIYKDKEQALIGFRS